MLDLTTAALSDLPEILARIRALRQLTSVSKVATHKTQSIILRKLSPEVMEAVAIALYDSGEMPTVVTVLSGR